MRMLSLCAALCAVSATVSVAQETEARSSASFVFHGETISITRAPAATAQNVSRFAGSGTACSQPCLGPVQLAGSVATLGESEVLDFMVDQVAMNTGLVIDARMPQGRSAGHMPGSVSLPHPTLDPDNQYRGDILQALGAQPLADGFDFSEVRHLLVYDDGPASGDAARLVENLLHAGYPAERIRYYRGGMLVWATLGFTIADGTGS